MTFARTALQTSDALKKPKHDSYIPIGHALATVKAAVEVAPVIPAVAKNRAAPYRTAAVRVEFWFIRNLRTLWVGGNDGSCVMNASGRFGLKHSTIFNEVPAASSPIVVFTAQARSWLQQPSRH